MTLAPPGVPDSKGVLARARAENFPVAARLFPKDLRPHLMAVYGFARLADQLGDDAPGDRASLLDWLSDELGRAYAARATHPLLVSLAATIERFDLPREPFDRLVEANRRDQRVHRYRTFEDLQQYCALSANPVGELVLRILGAATPERLALSDETCTGLQLVEFWQDLGEDAARGRIYIPLEDLQRFGYSEADLLGGIIDGRFTELMRFEAERTRWFLERGRDLGRTLPRRGGLGVRLFTAGGLAALADLERREFDTFSRSARASPTRRAWWTAAELSRTRRSGPRRALRTCEAITRDRARNFWYGIRLLPRPKRRALAAIYAVARRIDDVADDGLPPDLARGELERLRYALANPSPDSPDPILAGLAMAAERFTLPLGAFGDLINGVLMDVAGRQSETAKDLERYGRLVAGSIGRLSLAVFGLRDGSPPGPVAQELADDLGVAMQLTNILRDLREDLARGRVYLPAEDLDRYGCTVDDLSAGGARMAELVRFEAERAGRWFDRGLRLLPLLDRRSAACVGAMAEIYLRLLGRIAARPGAVLRERISLGRWEKVAVAIRALRGVQPSRVAAGTAPGLGKVAA
jgi:phytoene synthase